MGFGKNPADTQSTDYILLFLEREGKKFLDYISRIFSTDVECRLCKKYLMFNSRTLIFEPPIYPIDCESKIPNQERERKMFHENCILKYCKERPKNI